MKICLVSTQLGVGGAETQVCNLADKLAGIGHSVSIISLLGDPSSQPKNLDIDIVSLHMNKRNPLSVIKGMIHFHRYVKKFGPDVIHSHAVHANLFTRIMRPLSNFSVLVSTAHSNNEGGKFLMFLYRITDFLADMTTNVSDDAVENYIKKGVATRKKISRMYNGIDTEIFKFSINARQQINKAIGISDMTTLFLAAGRLSIEKDYPNLFQALKTLMLSGRLDKNWILLIAGSGHMQSSLEKLSQELKIDEHVKFLGVRKDLPLLMSAADIFVLSSQWEGFGLVVAEAMACECVVVSTDCGGTKEVIGGKGFICEPADSNSLALALEKGLALNNEERILLGKEARNRIVSEFNIDYVVIQWVNLYRSLYSKGKSTGSLE